MHKSAVPGRFSAAHIVLLAVASGAMFLRSFRLVPCWPAKGEMSARQHTAAGHCISNPALLDASGWSRVSDRKDRHIGRFVGISQ